MGRYTCSKCNEKKKKTEGSTCPYCRHWFCFSHLYSRVDGNNASITKYAANLCERCYRNAHPNG